jgi:prophage DNA circulation protein
MRRPQLSDETGLAGKILVGIVAWALGAVLLLTNTLVAAQQIDTRVDRITHTVGPIDHDLDSVALAVQTNETAQQILTAAKPLSGQADQVIQATASIDGTAKSINTAVAQIGDSVKGIDTNAHGINTTVVDINKTVKDINGTAKTISGTVNSIDGNVAAIGGSVHSIAERLGAVLDTARLIRGDHGAVGGGDYGTGIAGINRRADAVIALVQLIKGDTGNILTTARSIEASAKGIENNVDKFPTASVIPLPVL